MADETITLPYDGYDNATLLSFELVSGVYQTDEGYCTLYFKHGYNYYKVDNTNVGRAKEEEFGLCTLLFYKLRPEM